MSKVYLALYKGKRTKKSARIFDWLIRKFTKGQYSHCEIVVEQVSYTDRYDRDVDYLCYSASVSDGGVRKKYIDIASGKWDQVELSGVTAQQIENYYQKTKGQKYDF